MRLSPPLTAVALLVGMIARGHASPPASPRRGQTPDRDRAPAALEAALAGTWKIDRHQLPDNQDVWRRRLDALPATTAVPVSPAAPLLPGLPDPMAAWPVDFTNGLEISRLREAMRDLLETAERLSFDFAKDAVTITDDLNRARTYATTNQKEKRQLAATRFEVRTRWAGDALTQDATSGGFQMTEVYLPKEGNQELLVSLAISKPAFQPPIKDIMRVYSRVPPRTSSDPPRRRP